MLQPIFIPFPELQTERLLLRRIIPGDAAEVFFLRSDETVMQYIDKEKQKNIREAYEWITMINNNIDNNEGIIWGIVLRENPFHLIGYTSFWRIMKQHYRAEIGYALDHRYWKKSIMYEANIAIIRYGFNSMDLHSIEANINPGNKASEILLQKLGFVKEAHFKEDYYFEGKFSDTVIYSMLNKQ